MHTWDPHAVSPEAGLERLLQGNQRFVDGKVTTFTGFRSELADGQNPFAVIVGCSDSRVPAEIVFDLGLGDLFVIRVAGNIIAPSHIGSVEYAVSQFGTRLVVVMGHTRCGAVGATLSVLDGARSESRNIASITDRIAPSIREVAAAERDPQRRYEACVAANVRASVSQLAHGSRILEDLTLAGRIRIVGTVYAVETGRVSLLD
jgi:carbonic anhydrase